MRRAGLVAAVVATGLACGGWPVGSSLPLSVELTGEARDAAIAWGEQVADGRLPPEVVGADEAAIAERCAADGAAFVWLAARDERAEVRAAALRAVPPCLPVVLRADAIAAARTGLRAEDRAELAAAFALAGALLVEASAESKLVAEVVALTGAKDPAVRYDALLALDRWTWGEDPGARAAVIGALGAEQPWLVTEALEIVRFRASGVTETGPLRDALLPLLSDIDPGIRGRAALALARLLPEDPEVPGLLLAALADEHPYTRSAAAEAVGDVGHLPAAHALVAGLDDQRPNTWDMLPFERLDGTMVVQHHTGSVFERVDDAFLRSLQRVTAGLGEAGFVYREVHPGKWRDLDILAASRDARAWYEARRESLPPP